jgi:hypothetical protein
LKRLVVVKPFDDEFSAGWTTYGTGRGAPAALLITTTGMKAHQKIAPERFWKSVT